MVLIFFGEGGNGVPRLPLGTKGPPARKRQTIPPPSFATFFALPPPPPRNPNPPTGQPRFLDPLLLFIVAFLLYLSWVDRLTLGWAVEGATLRKMAFFAARNKLSRSKCGKRSMPLFVVDATFVWPKTYTGRASTK